MTETYELRLTVKEQGEIYALRTSHKSTMVLYQLLRDNAGTTWKNKNGKNLDWNDEDIIIKMNYEIAWAIREHLENTDVITHFRTHLFGKFVNFSTNVRRGISV